IALGLAYLFSRRLVDPIERLRRAAETLGKGQRPDALPLDSADEIGVLARTFDAMAHEVSAAREGLEERVRERTRELERSRASLVQSEKMAAVGQLAAGIAHEMNNPLGVIYGFAETALMCVEPGHRLEGPLKSIFQQSVRCKDLVE